ncbi:MAG: sigma-54 dependent transcriptional regulator [Bacteroidota bacterium]|nr:sigma-54 dependent transcriptional regulator [Bacteroidota bacterium]MDP4231924.1 sigma-54 dependent transcriptional regulator [Bacteroidota bacterium]MDP4241369.1 sigma-54 dependent transcriptional regulator [Bacteroidota bacterium]MDP4287292.1 sigma-54 dependent transcriptional regulator [Bacteroidota bacterium]
MAEISTSRSLAHILPEVALPRSLSVPLPDHIIAASEEMRELVSVVRVVAPTAITVLITGESGTGKEVFAELIHDLSGRKGPFVTVNCGAIPEGLIESELFGHEKGSFTGAVGQRKGFFEAAQSGTLFLDEIGEMPLALQVKLLRVLETGKFTRVGSTTQITTDARIIAATNRDLEYDVRAGTFRSDLYYRLRAVMLRIPPLRNRREDIPFLIETMLGEFVRRHHIVDASGKPQMPQLTPDATQMLIDHEWRGNIRELRNTLEQLVVLVCSITRADDRCVITQRDVERALASSVADLWDGGGIGHGGVAQDTRANRPLPAAPISMPKEQSERELIYRALIELRNEIADIKSMIQDGRTPTRTGTLALPPSTNGDSRPTIRPLEIIETEALEQALAHYQGNRRHAARALGISERTLYRKMKEKGLE